MLNPNFSETIGKRIIALLQPLTCQFLFTCSSALSCVRLLRPFEAENCKKRLLYARFELATLAYLAAAADKYKNDELPLFQ